MNFIELENWLLESLTELSKYTEKNVLNKESFTEVANILEEIRKDLQEDGDLEENHWNLTLNDFESSEPSMLFYVGYYGAETKYILSLTTKPEEIKNNCLEVSITDCEKIEELVKNNSSQTKEVVVPRSTGEYWLQLTKG